MKNNKSKLAKIFRPAWLGIFKPGRSENCGFTLIETLVAVTILSAAIAGPMVLSIRSIGSAAVSQDQLVAFYLGQEAIEFVKNARDTNILVKSSDWLDGLSLCKGVNGCYIDVIEKPVKDCGTLTGCPKLNFNGFNYTYKSDGSDGNTVFTRTVKIDDLIRTDGDEAKIDVAVSWTGKYGQKTMNLQNNIFNWYDYE